MSLDLNVAWLKVLIDCKACSFCVDKMIGFPFVNFSLSSFQASCMAGAHIWFPERVVKELQDCCLGPYMFFEVILDRYFTNEDIFDPNIYNICGLDQELKVNLRI